MIRTNDARLAIHVKIMKVRYQLLFCIDLPPLQWARSIGVAALVAFTVPLMSFANESQPINRAKMLVQALANRDGVPTAAEKFNGQVAFGGMNIQIDDARQKLSVRVFVAPTWWKTANDVQKENVRRTARSLNDPRIGGMYERAGGYFVFDEAKGFYLTRDFSLENTTPESFIAVVESLRQIAARWTTEWFSEVAQISNGHRPAPKERVPYIPR